MRVKRRLWVTETQAPRKCEEEEAEKQRIQEFQWLSGALCVYPRPHEPAAHPIRCRLHPPRGVGRGQGRQNPHCVEGKLSRQGGMKDLPLAARGVEAAPETGSSCAHFNCFSFAPQNSPSSACYPQKFHGEKNAVNSQLLGSQTHALCGTPFSLGF